MPKNTETALNGIGAFSALLALGLSMSVLAAGLAGSEWRPVKIGEAVPPDGVDIFVGFKTGGQLSGYAGCNRFFGPYEISDDRIRVGPLAATRMACPDAAMALESDFLKALEAAIRFIRDDHRLMLIDKQGATSASFIQTDWD